MWHPGDRRRATPAADTKEGRNPQGTQPPAGPSFTQSQLGRDAPKHPGPHQQTVRQPSQKAAQAQPGPADGVGPRVCTLRPGLVLKGSLGPVDLGLDTALALCYTDRNTNGPETAVRGRRELTH